MDPGVDDGQAKPVPPVPVPPVPVVPPVVVPEPVPPVVPVEPVPPVVFGPPLPISFEMTPVQAESPRTNVRVAKMDQARNRLLSLRNFEVGAIPSILKCLFRVCGSARARRSL
jgi:hypothetical protein